MSNPTLTRTTYRDPYATPPQPPRSGDVAHAEAAVDMDMYYRPLEQLHGAGLHEWGVASGLRVNVTLGSPGIQVLAGVGIDTQGRHISLAPTGEAEIGANVDASGATPNLVTVDAGTGASVPTTGLSGEKYVTVQWWETFDTDGYNNYGAYRYDHTPWIRLRDVGTFSNDGASLVLAKVTLDASGKVTAINATLRQGTGVPVQRVDLQKGAAVSSTSAANTSYGAISPLTATGGISINVPNAVDEIHLERQNGAMLTKVALTARTIVARDSAGRETVSIDTVKGNLTVGTTGVDGDLLVKDASNRLAVAIDSTTARVYAGTDGSSGGFITKDSGGRNSTFIDGSLSRLTAGVAGGHAGGVVTLDNAGHTSIKLDGAPGDVWFRGKLKDINNSYGGIGHADLKALISHDTIDLHRHRTGSTTNSHVRWLHAYNGTSFDDIDLGSQKQVFALIMLAVINPHADFDSDDGVFAEIYQIDGVVTPVSWYGDDLGPLGSDSNMHALTYRGKATRIRFRLRSLEDAGVIAICLVFVEE